MPKKKDKSPLRMTPPGQIEDLEKAREAFLSEPEKKKQSKQATPKQNKKPAKKELPWEQPGVSDRVIKSFNFRFPEPDFLKLKFVIKQNREKSMQSFCANIIKKEVEKHLKKMV